MIEIYIYPRFRKYPEAETVLSWVSDDNELLGMSEQFIANQMGWTS